MHVGKLIIIAASCLAISACAGAPSQPSSFAPTETASRDACGNPVAREESMKVDMVKQLVRDGQYYSALAHLEQNPGFNAEALWLQAEGQRKTGMLDEALESYRKLSQTCMTAQGYAGMAKILAAQGKVSEAYRYMESARKAAPTNADIRNDYGFILLAHREFKSAQREFMTALQLTPGHPVATRNMVMSLILSGEPRTAVQMAKSNNIDEAEFRALLDKANSFRQPAFATSDNINKDAPL